MSYSTVHRIDNMSILDDMHDASSVLGAAASGASKVVRLRCYSWGPEKGMCDWRRRANLIDGASTDLLDIIIITDLYSNFARQYISHRFNSERYDIYVGRRAGFLVATNIFLFCCMCALIMWDPYQNRSGTGNSIVTPNNTNTNITPPLYVHSSNDTNNVAGGSSTNTSTTAWIADELLANIVWWLFFAAVIFMNIFVLHTYGTGCGILLIVKKTLQAFPLQNPELVKHGAFSSTGYMTFRPIGSHLLTIVGGLSGGDAGCIQLARVMQQAREGSLLVGNFGRPVNAFMDVERAPFATIVDSGFIAILAQHTDNPPTAHSASATSVTGSTGRTREVDNYLCSVFATIKLLHVGDPDEEVVVMGDDDTPPLRTVTATRA